MSQRKRIALFTLGGTIAMTGRAGQDVKPTLDAEALIEAVPALDDIATLDVAALHRIPGPHIGEDDVLALAAAVSAALSHGADGAVVVQGTDTIEETAFLLDLLIRADAPVVVTGAMSSADRAGADGPANLLAAVQTATAESARGLGTLVVFNEEIHAARFVRKAHTWKRSAFTSLPAPIGGVVEGRAAIDLRPARTPGLPGAPEGSARPVSLLTATLGDDGRLVRGARAAGAAGLVVAGFGGGHVPPAMADALESAAREVPVVLSTRCWDGGVLSVTYGYTGGEIDLGRRGLVPAGQLDAIKARLLLAMLLRAAASTQDIRAAFAHFARG